MGTYSPSPKVSAELEDKINKSIIEPSIAGLKAENSEFVGILFAGLMVENGEPKLLEYNIRFGDPETQVILPRLKTDFIELIMAATNQELDKINIEFDDNKHVLCVVMAANGYPGSYKKGTEIDLSKAEKLDNTKIFHAGTKKDESKLLSCGGRVLSVVTRSKDFKSAREGSLKLLNEINWDNGFYRKDIGYKVIQE